jgi:hypothetical protein
LAGLGVVVDVTFSTTGFVAIGAGVSVPCGLGSTRGAGLGFIGTADPHATVARIMIKSKYRKGRITFSERDFNIKMLIIFTN